MEEAAERSGQCLRIVKIFVQRPMLTLESELRNLLRRLRIRLPHDLGWELEEIVARGIQIVFGLRAVNPA